MNIEEIKMDHFENFEELIKTCKLWIEIDDIDAYYRFFEFNCMKTFVTAYEKEKAKNKEYNMGIKNLISQIESAIDFMKTNKSKIKVDMYKQKEEDLKLEIVHLKKLLKEE